MFEKPTTFEKPHRAEEEEVAPVPSRSPWEPLTLMLLIGIAAVIVLVAIVVTRAFNLS
jgi:hypothetical protein